MYFMAALHVPGTGSLEHLPFEWSQIWDIDYTDKGVRCDGCIDTCNCSVLSIFMQI